jgi:hypothetical protein
MGSERDVQQNQSWFDHSRSASGFVCAAGRQRHDIVRRLQANTMPPNTGIADEKARQNLIVLAQRFAELGDKALAYESSQLTTK